MSIEIKIKKKYEGFTLDMELTSEGGHLGVLGASGSGKSMLLKCIAGVIKPDQGFIRINGKDLFNSGLKINVPSRNRKVGIIFQNYALFPHLTLWDNIVFGMGGFSEAEKKEKVESLIEKFHLTGMENRYPSQISGGQQQRVSIARALAPDPDILLLDEPFSALDENLKHQMILEMQEFMEGFEGETIYVTHNMDEAYTLCHNIAAVSNGKIVSIAPKEEMFNRPTCMEAAKVTGCKNIWEGIFKGENLVEIPELRTTLRVGAVTKAGSQAVEQISGLSIGGPCYVGIREKSIKFLGFNDDKSKESDLAQFGEKAKLAEENILPATVVNEMVLPSNIKLYARIGSAANSKEDYNVQLEIPAINGDIIRTTAFSGDIHPAVAAEERNPVRLYLPPENLFLMPRR